MRKSGAEHHASTEVVFLGADRRLRPPDHLSNDAREAFISLVGAMPAAHFKAGELPLICRWCSLTALAERAERELDRCVVGPDGRVSGWFNVLVQTTKALTALAPRLKVGPSARAPKASKKETAPMSAYDRMRQQPGWDKLP